MKKIKLLLVAVFSIYAFSGVNMAYGFSGIKPVESPAVASLKYLQASEFVKLSAKEYTALTGKKLNFLQRLSFSVTKMKMKRDLKKNPNLKITDYIDADSTTFQIDALWLILGVLIGPICRNYFSRGSVYVYFLSSVLGCSHRYRWYHAEGPVPIQAAVIR